jgi:integrase
MLQRIRGRRDTRRPQTPVFDALGRRRSPITTSEYRMGRTPPNAGHKYPPEPLTREEVARVLAACGRGAAGYRNRALIVVLYRAGLRISEALALYPKDIDTKAGAISVLEGKGRKHGTVGIDPQALEVLERWLSERARLGVTGRHPVFCTITRDVRGPGRPVSSSYVRGLCTRLGKKAGVEKRVHPHGFRHTHAFELANEGHPMHLIQAQLRHNSLAVTGRYLAHIAPTALLDAMRSRTWVSDHDELLDAAA